MTNQLHARDRFSEEQLTSERNKATILRFLFLILPIKTSRHDTCGTIKFCFVTRTQEVKTITPVLRPTQKECHSPSLFKKHCSHKTQRSISHNAGGQGGAQLWELDS